MKHPIYERPGVRAVINAVRTRARIGGSLMAPEVVQSMVEPSKAFVSFKELSQGISSPIRRTQGEIT